MNQDKKTGTHNISIERLVFGFSQEADLPFGVRTIFQIDEWVYDENHHPQHQGIFVRNKESSKVGLTTEQHVFELDLILRKDACVIVNKSELFDKLNLDSREYMLSCEVDVVIEKITGTTNTTIKNIRCTGVTSNPAAVGKLSESKTFIEQLSSTEDPLPDLEGIGFALRTYSSNAKVTKKELTQDKPIKTN